MLVSRKGRYSVRAIVTLALLQKKNDGKPVKLSDVAAHEKLPSSYIEQLFNKLKKGGIVSSIKGPGGGYTLASDSSNISIFDILNCVGDLGAFTDCDGTSKKNYECTSCSSRYIWDSLDKKVKEHLSSIKIEEILKKHLSGDDYEANIS